ncbi:MAG: molybdate ABC transporter substrate-binding protein [Methanospirillum sp.]|uniref:molybdate ABC transporter substrate-binding protein n=1 Tax=Methanospirillum sp. TaxID=45200 RepID=UPI00236BDE93|nr:molybdate ABC transporter substrate-binding protein [Methanospirillum sp.]MDD1729018.1 molybdate ABC transporter substrate-binding protein [Methanospirillum sp.]
MQSKVTRSIILALMSLVIAGLLIPGALAADTATQSANQSSNVSIDDLMAKNPDALLIYAGAGLKKAVQEIGSSFTNETGIPVVYNFQGSGALLTQMDITRKGDVLIAGGSDAFQKAEDKGLVGEPQYLAYHVPIVTVQKGNPKNITSIEDFANSGLKIGLGDVKATAIGLTGDNLFKDLGIADDVEKNVVVRTSTINELVSAMNAGSIDASLLTLDQINDKTMDTIPVKNVNDYVLVVSEGTTTFSKQPENAQKFVDYTASDAGKAVFKKFGFPIYGDEEYKDVKP